MKILLTGGAGFIGSAVANRYLQEGHEVIIVDDLSTGSQRNIPTGARFYQLSLTDPEIKQLILHEQPHIVNHHAAQIDVRKSTENPVQDAEINIIGSLRLLEASGQARIQKFIFASSGGAIYGEQDCFPADERQPPHPVNPYGISKLTVEKYIEYFSRTYGFPSVILRYANVYGPRQNAVGEAGVVSIFISRILQNEPLILNGDGTQTRDFVYVDDVVQCNLAALSSEVQGTFNVGTGIETDIASLVKILERITGVMFKTHEASLPTGDLKRSCLAAGRLQKKPATPFTEGLARTLDWFKTQC